MKRIREKEKRVKKLQEPDAPKRLYVEVRAQLLET